MVEIQQISHTHALDNDVIDIELEYVGINPILFKCKWFETFNRSHARINEDAHC
jgi:hypothetical protein